jgi:hypothetical protein
MRFAAHDIRGQADPVLGGPEVAAEAVSGAFAQALGTKAFPD